MAAGRLPGPPLPRDGVRVDSRRGFDLTARCPELAALPDALGSDAVLDGELVVLGGDGKPSFDAVRRRLLLGEGGNPLVYVAFDLLWLDGRALVSLAYEERRGILENLDLAGPHFQVCPSYVGEGSALFEATRTEGLEGIVAQPLGLTVRQERLRRPGR
jgi:bifunctional non-homologous end joining protein LigD